MIMKLLIDLSGILIGLLLTVYTLIVITDVLDIEINKINHNKLYNFITCIIGFF